MSQKSLNTLLKAQVLDASLAIKERKRALKSIVKPRKAFLKDLIENRGTPVELIRAAQRCWIESVTPQKSTEDIQTPGQAIDALVKTIPHESEEIEVLDPVLFDLLGFEADNPRVRRGPRTPETLEIERCFEQAKNPQKSATRPKSAIPRPEHHYDR